MKKHNQKMERSTSRSLTHKVEWLLARFKPVLDKNLQNSGPRVGSAYGPMASWLFVASIQRNIVIPLPSSTPEALNYP